MRIQKEIIRTRDKTKNWVVLCSYFKQIIETLFLNLRILYNEDNLYPQDFVNGICEVLWGLLHESPIIWNYKSLLKCFSVSKKQVKQT